MAKITKPFSTRLTPALIDRVTAVKKGYGIYVSELTEVALTKYLDAFDAYIEKNNIPTKADRNGGDA